MEEIVRLKKAIAKTESAIKRAETTLAKLWDKNHVSAAEIAARTDYENQKAH